MTRCEHAYKSIGKFYSRRRWFLGGHLFTVFRYRECMHCNKLERKVVMKKRVTESADSFERQLKFSGIKPEGQMN